MKTKRYFGGRGTAALLAISIGLLSPLAAWSQETVRSEEAPAGGFEGVPQGTTTASDAPASAISETPIPSPTEPASAEDPVEVELVDPVTDSPAVFERNRTLSGIHRGLGWATVIAGLTTGVLNPEVVGEDVHATLGITSAALAASTMLFGFLAHYGEVGPKFKLSANNVHALMGAAGGVMMMIAPFVAPSDAHKALGEGGALLMGASIVWKIVF